MPIIQVLFFSFMLVPLASLHSQPKELLKHSTDSRLFSAEGLSRKFSRRLSKPLIGNNGRIYACSGKDLFAFESNGLIAWTIHLNYTCNADIAPVYGGREKIYVAADNRILKVNLQNNGTSEPLSEVLLNFLPPDKEGRGEVTAISVTALSSSIFVNIKGRGIFAYTMWGELQWSAGPVLNRFGYRQGCRKNETDCYFTSVPVIDQCEAAIYISNTQGELYSLSTRSPQFKWIRDLSSFDKFFTVTPGNNGRLYVVVPVRTLLLALDVWTGNVLWQGSIGPLSSADSSPVIDSNGWVSIGSLDGFLYSFSPSGVLKKFSKARASESVIQVSPVLDCSGYGVYISQTEMEGKTSHTIGEYAYVSALKTKSVIFTLFVPATGSIYWSETFSGELSSSLSNTDLHHFVLDERILLAFFAASKTGNKLACRSRRQKLISTCSQARPRLLRLYTGSERAIFLFLLFESAILIILAGLVRFCCVFWRKKKLQGQNLGSFLDKRRSLRLKKKSFDRTITDLRCKAGEEAADSEVLGKLDDLVREREGIKRKLSTTYSLGRDETSPRSRSLLPLYDGKSRSFSSRGSKKERVTILHTLSDTSSEDSGGGDETSWDLDEELEKGKPKATTEEADCSGDEDGGIFGREMIRRSPSEPTSSSLGIQKALVGNENVHGSRSLSLKRRKALSSTN